MRISINAHEREIALFALDLADKQCDSTRKGLELLRLEPMALMALQGHVGELRRALKDLKRHVYDWSFDDRRALATALHVYRAKLDQLEASETKLIVETSATDEKIGDVKDFIARLAGQDTFWDEPADDVAQEQPVAKRADAKQEELRVEWPMPAVIAEQLELAADAPRGDVVLRLERLAGLLERGPETRFGEEAFGVLARFALTLCARVVPEFDGTMQGGFLLQEVVYDDVNAMVLASWIRQQLESVRPPKVTAEQILEMRKSIGKESHDEHEAQILAENDPRNPLEVACSHCGAGPAVACHSVSGKIVGSEPHMARMHAAGATERRHAEVAIALYSDAVLLQVFGRVDDEIRTAVKKRRSIDLEAKWAQTLLHSTSSGGAHATA